LKNISIQKKICSTEKFKNKFILSTNKKNNKQLQWQKPLKAKITNLARMTPQAIYKKLLTKMMKSKFNSIKPTHTIIIISHFLKMKLAIDFIKNFSRVSSTLTMAIPLLNI
jgi:hypothetical protein